MKPVFPLAVSALFWLAACGPDAPNPPSPPPTPDDVPTPADDGPPPDETSAALTPPALGEPGGLSDDRTPVEEGPIAPDSAQGAGQVLQTYFALIEEAKYDEAYVLWSGRGDASGDSAVDFADRFSAYSEVHANIGAPGRIEGAAGTLYVEVPVQLYGRLAATDEEFNRRGTATLRRANDVPGASEDQLAWRIDEISYRN